MLRAASALTMLSPLGENVGLLVGSPAGKQIPDICKDSLPFS